MMLCVCIYVLMPVNYFRQQPPRHTMLSMKKWTGGVHTVKYYYLPVQLIYQLHRKNIRDLSTWGEAIRVWSNLQELIKLPEVWMDYKLSPNIRYFAFLICVFLKAISIDFHHSKDSYKHEQWDGFKNEQTLMAVLHETHSLLPLTESVGKLS